MADSDLDRQARLADSKLGNFGFVIEYGRKFFDNDNPSKYKVDSILYVLEEENLLTLQRYAKEKFHYLNDT